MSTALDTTSQHNKILPSAASENAPFEQTFRITVCLPMDQLFVVRIGAKTKLSVLLDLVCTNKLLEKEKYELTHPTNIDQVFDLELTIGEVGLNEIRLANKMTVPPPPSSVVKYRPTVDNNQHLYRHAVRPQSMFVTKSSPSPYSSTTSLNSTDSSSMNTSSIRSHMPVAPSRKKRMAPRPPSQNSIPEDNEMRRHERNSNGKPDDDTIFKRPLDRKDFHVSSPNLSHSTHMNGGMKYKDFHVSNGNIYTINEPSGDNSLSGSDITNGSDGGIGKSTVIGRSLICSLPYDERYDGGDLNGNRYSNYLDDGHHSRASSEASESTRDGGFPEPTSRKNLVIGMLNLFLQCLKYIYINLYRRFI